jgi:RimJ/RimL family protein N-acetyltransferase
MDVVSSHSGDIRLRPVEERDLEILERFDTDPALSEPFEWRGYRDRKARRRRWEQDGYLGTDDSVLVVSLSDGTFAGFVAWRPLAISGPQGVIQIGIVLLPEHRGRGIGSRAQQLLADYLYSTTTAHRLEASTEVDNLAEQRALARAGFTKEGVLRGRGFVRGQWRDGFMYSRLRGDPAPDVADVQEPPG